MKFLKKLLSAAPPLDVYMFILFVIEIFLWMCIYDVYGYFEMLNSNVGIFFWYFPIKCFTLRAKRRNFFFWKNDFTYTTKYWKYFSSVFSRTQNKYLKNIFKWKYFTLKKVFTSYQTQHYFHSFLSYTFF